MIFLPKIAKPMSETLSKCPNCDEIIDSIKNRVITEQCGHIKCRLCFIREENGCILCNQQQSTSLIKNPVKQSYNDVISINFNDDLSNDIDSDENELRINTDTSGSLDSFEELDLDPEKKSEIVPSSFNKISCNKKVEILENVLISSKEINLNSQKLNSSQLKNETSDTIPPHIVENKKRNNNKSTYTCKICQKTFKSKNNRKYHLYCDPSIPKPFPCKQCDKRFITASHLEYHRKIHLNSNIFACRFCDKRYLREISLKKHERKHKNEFKYLCNVCNKKFLYREQLKVHENQHNNISFPCSQCDKTFFNKSNLTQHLSTHSGIKPVTCKVCNKKFSRNSALKTHQLIHSKNRPFKCKICGKGFLDQRSLERHSRIHFDSPLYECTLCTTKSNRKDNIRRHVRNLHSGAKEGIKSILTTIFENYNETSASVSTASPKKHDQKTLDSKLNATSVIKFIGKTNVETEKPKNIPEKTSVAPQDCSVIVNNSASTLTSNDLISVETNTEPEENTFDSPDHTVYKPLTLDPPPSPPTIEPLQMLPTQSNINIYRQLLSPYLKSTGKAKSDSQSQTQTSDASAACVSNNFGQKGNGTRGNSTIIDKPPKKMYDKNEIYRSIMDKQ